MTDARHTGLIVEDDADTAEELRGTLEAIGHDSVVAATLEEARVLAERGGFCYVICDRQIKATAKSIKPLVEAGDTALERIRAAYPGVDARGAHYLQILIMSGHAKEHEDVVRAFQMGANDFITKPLGASKRPVREIIEAALRRSGREEHDRCPEACQLARAPSRSEQISAASAAIPLVITGERVDRRIVVEAAGVRVPLPESLFVILFRLVVARTRNPETWLHTDELAKKAGEQYLSRLRHELRQQVPTLVSNDKHGGYRLHPSVIVARVDAAALEKHTDAPIQKLAREFRELSAERLRKAKASEPPEPEHVAAGPKPDLASVRPEPASVRPPSGSHRPRSHRRR